MEAPTSATLGAMGSLLMKLDVLLASGCRLPQSVKDGMRLLKNDLEKISGCLQDLSEVEDPPLTAKCWMKEVRELSYDIEDYIDKTRFVCKISHVKITRLPKRHQLIANMISEFRIYVQEAIERHERYELHCRTFRRRFVSVGPMLPTPYEETAELVIDGRTNKFINSLANDEDQQLKVVSIVGPECLGKTTLAKMLYNKFRGQFDCRAFIRVSQKPDMKRLFCDMLWQVQRQPPPDDCKELDLIDNIRKHLQDKRYLIIIDDLWAASVWDIINHAFPEGSRRSRIITTTQIEDVALTCCCYRSEFVFEMKPLDDDHSRKLFFNRRFGSESDCPQQFEEISNKTVDICGGLPLAIVHIANLLESQPVILLELWMYLCDSLSSDLRTNSTSERMRQVLNLSFNNLPHHLKTCLLYLNMYPEGHKIFKDDLVKQWVAEGFIDRIEGRDMKKVAGSYFDELIDRRFIQPIDINYNDEVLSCTVHDVVRDLIAYKSVEENFIVVVDYYRKNVEISDKVRRLSLCFGNAKYAKTPANIRTSQVRSLTFSGLFECMPSVTEFKLLRVLNLQLSGHHGDDTLDLTGISELFQLRYLKIACNICIELPNHMRGLQYLETLDMDTKVTAVPWDIIYIPRLLHLRLPVETNLLDWIGSMGSFSEQSLGNLTNLRDLHLTCSTPPSDHLVRNMEALGSLLGVLGNLRTLALLPGYSRKNVVVRNASEVIVSWDYLAPPLLQRFEWLPQSCIFSRVPKWIGELVNLCILKIAVRELLRNGVDILKGLPALTALSLYVQTTPVEMIVFDKAGFSVLKYFKFKCSVPWLKFEADAMPNLRKLMLGFNALGADQRGTTPISIEHLPSLKEISAKIGGAGSDADSALAIAVSSHPRNPRINVHGSSMVTKEKEYGTLEEKDEILEEDPDKHYGTQDGESREDENKQAGCMARQERQHGTPVDQEKIMEDDPDENKQTGRRISTLPESSSHLPVPELKKDESKPGKALAIVSVSQGAMGSLLGKLGDLLAAKYKLLKEAKGEIRFLKAELESMHAFLEKMSDVEESDKQAKCWVKEVRELSYDIEDSVDEFMLRVERESNSKPHGFKGFIDMSINLLRTIHTRHKIAMEFQGIKSRVVEVSERRMRYKVDDAVSKPNNTPIDPRMLALYAETAGLVGIDEPREELIGLMMDEEGVPSQQLKVLSIVGFGGLGKTTLANEIYRKLKRQFQCCSFVSVTQKPNIRKILKNILSQVGYVAPEQTNMEIWDEHELINTLQKFLTDKRYIIVLDDIWDANAWNIIRCALPENKYGSRVITTTRIETVAVVCCSNHYGHVYKMRPLSNEDSRSLFFKRIFGPEGACPPNLEEVSAKILKRCGGLPLAVITISSLLASRRNKLKEHWEHVGDSLGSNLEVNPTLDGMRQMLSLSYISLPHYLKTCMLYLGIYPVDYTIHKYELVRQWVAQGFISKALGRDPEDVAEGYFNELVNRSIIQPVRIDPNDVVLSCRVHDMMLDLIVHKCREENFITAIDDIQDITRLHDKVRRLSLYLDGAIDGTTLGTVQLSQVRALARFGTSTYIPPLLQFKHLRVLTLEFPSRNSEEVIIDLTEMCHLFQLRYLKIVAHGKIALPSKIRGLQQLETLEIGGYIVEVPSDVVHLCRLLHLIIPGGISLPDGIGNMKSLRTLQTLSFYENSIDTIRDIGDLTNLRDLKISIPYDLEQLDDIARQRVNVLCSSLEKLCNLNYMCMHCFAWCDELSSLPVCSRLQRLDFGNVSRVPKWISKLHNLYDLKLDINEVREDDVGILAQLPSLTGLHLRMWRTPKETMVICGTGFPVLKHFKISCARIAYLTFEAGAMPRLQRLKMRFNAEGWDKYGAAPAGIEHLSSLKEISVRIGGIRRKSSTIRVEKHH